MSQVFARLKTLLRSAQARTLETLCSAIGSLLDRFPADECERLQLADTERLQTTPALYMVIAWRINRLMRLGHTLPDLPADLLFEPDEWRAAFILNKKPVPRQTPTLNTVVRLIAQRGGFLGRKHDGEPGARTIWLGMQEIAVFVEGARYARQFNDG